MKKKESYFIEVEHDPDSGLFIASDDLTACYGTGSTRLAAVLDYLSVLDDDRYCLGKNHRRLHPLLKKRLRAICRFLDEKV